jgi:arabinose-5-phosphate isomerase
MLAKIREKINYIYELKKKQYICHHKNSNFAMLYKEIKSIVDREAEAVRNIPVTESYEKAVHLIVEHVHRQGGTLIISGMGKAGQIAMNVATTFSSTGTPAFFLHPSEAQHGDLGIMRGNDVMLLISNSGKTRELEELVCLSRGLVPEIQFIIITSNPDSPLAREADVCLLTGAPEEVCPLGLTPTTSTTVMTVIGDMLVVSVMKAIGFTNSDYAKRHHGGYLGEKSREQSKY